MCSKDNVIVINLDEARYDQDSYWGRVRNFFTLHNPFNLFACPSTLEEAKCLYLKYRCQEPLPTDIDEEELWRAKALYESAYHQETGEKISFLARPAAQIPMNSLLAGGMMTYYQSVPGIIVWQWLNQSYNAFVSYANKGDDAASFTEQQLMTSYVLATGTAVGTALGLRHLMKGSPSIVARFVPLAAVAAAHCVNVPLMRAQMLKNGAPIFDECDVKLGYSKRAAQAGIGGVIFDKVLAAVPPMVITPIVMNYMERRGTLCRYPWMNFPAHVVIAGFCLSFISPFLVALFNDKALLPYKHLEPELREHLCKKLYDRPPKYVYFNKGS